MGQLIKSREYQGADFKFISGIYEITGNYKEDANGIITELNFNGRVPSQDSSIGEAPVEIIYTDKDRFNGGYWLDNDRPKISINNCDPNEITAISNAVAEMYAALTANE